MEIETYQTLAYKYAVYPQELRKQGRPDVEDRVNYALIGLAGEAGELLNKWKKVYRDHDGHVNIEIARSLLAEAADVMWYIAAMHTELGYSLDDSVRMNLEKLQDRRARNTIHGKGDHR